jgi:hypothetical protein
MKGRAVKKEYEGRRFTEEALPFYENFWGRSLWDCIEES